MPGRISEDSRPGLVMRLELRLPRTQFQQPGFGLVQVVLDVEADVELLGNGLAGPARSSVAVHLLKAEEKSVLTVEAGEIGVRLRMKFEACGLLIEGRQCRMGSGQSSVIATNFIRRGMSSPDRSVAPSKHTPEALLHAAAAPSA